MGMVHIIRRALKKLRYPDIDSSGNIIASVIPRTGTLAQLMTITDAGNGEVATATNVAAQVIYKGTSPSVPKAYFKNGLDFIAMSPVDGFSLAGSNVDTVLSIGGARCSPGLLIDAGNNWVNMPAHLQYATSLDYFLCSLEADINISSLDAGAIVSVKMQVYNSTTTAWVDSDQSPITAIADGSGNCILKGSQLFFYAGSNIPKYNRVRAVIRHSSATSTAGIFPGYVHFKGQLVRKDD